MPEIQVEGNSVVIVDGDTTPSLADHTDFGTVTVGGAQVRTFSVRNIGNANLTVNVLSITGSSEFLAVSQPGTPIIPGGFATSEARGTLG